MEGAIYYQKSAAYQMNCQKCVPTYEMRMRGLDVVAKPVYLKDTGKEKIIKNMSAWGAGARAEIYVAWANGGSHVFVAENRNGAIHFLDPQTGRLDVEDYFDYVKKGLTRFFRIDNLEVNEKYIKWFCKEAE